MPQRYTTKSGKVLTFPDDATVDEIQAVADAEDGVESGKSVGGFLNNAKDSAINFAKSLNPVESVPAVLRLLKGGVDMAVPGIPTQDELNLTKLPGAMADMAKQRYGGWENIKNTAYTDPVGMLADASTVLGGTGGVLKATGMAPKLARAATVASDVTNPLRAVTYPAAKLARGTGMMMAHVTTRPGTTLQKQAGSKYRIGREVAEKGLYTTERAGQNLTGAINKAKETVRASNLPPTPRANVVKLDKTLDDAMRRTGSVDESVDAVAGLQNRLVRDLPPDIPVEDLFEFSKLANRERAGLMAKHRMETPGGPDPIVGRGWNEVSGNVRDVLGNIDGLQADNRAVQTAMLADAAVRTAQARPHALSRIVALGTGLGMRNALGTAAIIGMDSPMLGAAGGHLAWKAGDLLDSKALLRAALAARLAQPPE
jgi:hypothetical protein